MATIVKNCCTSLFLDFFKHQVIKSRKWNFNYPMGKPFEDKHAKIDVIQGDTMHDEFLGGVSMSLLMMIHETAKKQNVDVPLDLLFCGISMKDEHREDNLHTDHEKDELQDTPIIKVLGILNSDWKKSYGGGFEHGGILHSLEPGDFIVFDPRVPHRAQDIFTDNKRIAIDWTIRNG
tara:strand:+ start:324 stop:854 length:531 start_codon:yes stop_codon:yes gene_type:complete